jgi:voltage-gated potassium channel Kch
MSNKFTLRERLRYSFDNTLSAGTIAIIAWLAVLSLLIVIIAGAALVIFGIHPPETTENYSFFEAEWISLMRTFDSGNVAGDNGWSLRIIMLIVTIGGIFIFSALIGVLNSGLEAKLEELRKGRSKVLESDHTLILGWSSKVIPILSELIIANESQKKPKVVILADKDKVEMEDELHDKIPDWKNTRIICRSGSPIDLTDLSIVNPYEAKSIIILSPESENPDIYVIKSILAITNNPHRKKEKYHIVAEIKKEENLDAAQMVGGDEAVFVHTSDLLARLTAQTCRQSGLSVVYIELLDFKGNEIYFKTEPTLANKTFKDTLFAYKDSAVIGFMDKNGDVVINPPMDSIIPESSQIIGITEDDSKFNLTPEVKIVINKETIKEQTEEKRNHEKNLILGWNEKAKQIISELDQYVLTDSDIFVLAEGDDLETELENLKDEIKNQKIHLVHGNIADRNTLDRIQIHTFNNVIVLGYTDIDIQEADARTLIALLHLRAITESKNIEINLVSEMFDIKNKKLAEVTKAEDFIIGDNIISLMISQLSENKHLKKVFDILFSPEGSEVYLKPASNYIKTGVPVDFYTVLESASRRNEVAIGYRLKKFSHDPEKEYGVLVNPDKCQKLAFTEEDKIIVLAEN